MGGSHTSWSASRRMRPGSSGTHVRTVSTTEYMSISHSSLEFKLDEMSVTTPGYAYEQIELIRLAGLRGYGLALGLCKNGTCASIFPEPVRGCARSWPQTPWRVRSLVLCDGLEQRYDAFSADDRCEVRVAVAAIQK